jgi:hypothetical protein
MFLRDLAVFPGLRYVYGYEVKPMSDAELLIKEVQALPEGYVHEVLNFISRLKEGIGDGEYPPGFPERLKGKVSPKLYGKGTIHGDIIGPFYEEWENGF